jgi:hypothetical protein
VPAIESPVRFGAGRRPWRKVVRICACALALLALAAEARAQSDEDGGVWLGAFANGALPSSVNNERSAWRLWTDVQVRFGDDASRFSQGIIRPGIGFVLGRGWTIWAGYAYVRTEPPYAGVTANEQRIWEQASWARAIRTTALSSRTRLEQRFLSTGKETGWRLREMVKVSQRLGAASIWSAVVYDEYFVNVNSTDFGAAAGSDRNRLFIGPGVKVSKSASVEVGYLNQYTFRTNRPDRIDHVFSASLFWNF